MKFIDLDRQEIVRNSTICDGYYIYTLGTPVEITTLKSLHKNDMIANNLSEELKEDKLMVKYSPTNKIYFSRNFIEDDNTENYASCYVDKKNGRLYVGTVEEFDNSTGILAFSGYLSLNGHVEEDRLILCTKKTMNSLIKRVRVMTLGVRGDKLYALFYVPSVKGMKLSNRETPNKGISPMSYKSSPCSADYCSFTIKDWFDGLTKIKEK